MSKYSRSHVADAILELNLRTRLVRDRTNTADILADMAEIDSRKLYVSAGFPSMRLYCLHELEMSDDIAYKRIRAARAARSFPAIFDAIADGRLHLSAVVMLAPYLTRNTADELLEAATKKKTKAEIEALLAQRFPKPDVPAFVRPLTASPSPAAKSPQLAPGPVQDLALQPAEIIEPPATANVEAPQPKVTPLSPERFAIQFTIGKDTHELLQYAEQLLSHAIPSGDTGQVFHRLLELAIPELEKRKFAAAEKRRSSRSSSNPRHIPAHVKQAVWERDGGQCSFVSERGRRCPSRKFLEFDHVDPVARGGQATEALIRLRCSAHNQHEAERTFGVEFMKNKREEARRAAAEKRAAKERAKAETLAEAAAAAERAKEQDVVPWLRALGFRAEEARKAAELCENIPDASLEQRVRVALTYFGPKHAPAH